MSSIDLFLSKRHVSRETIERLDRLALLLNKWNPAINLVAPQTLQDVWQRHFLDSAQVFDCVKEPRGSWVDLGSGGGFPGLIVAILALDEAPEVKVTLVESDKRKAAFLSAAVREMGLPAKVLADRIEMIPPLRADVVSARALASLDVLLGYAHRHLTPGGVAIFPKGARWQDEVAIAEKTWSFTYEVVRSITNPLSVTLKIKGLTRV